MYIYNRSEIHNIYTLHVISIGRLSITKIKMYYFNFGALFLCMNIHIEITHETARTMKRRSGLMSHVLIS